MRMLFWKRRSSNQSLSHPCTHAIPRRADTSQRRWIRWCWYTKRWVAVSIVIMQKMVRVSEKEVEWPKWGEHDRWSCVWCATPLLDRQDWISPSSSWSSASPSLLVSGDGTGVESGVGVFSQSQFLKIQIQSMLLTKTFFFLAYFFPVSLCYWNVPSAFAMTPWEKGGELNHLHSTRRGSQRKGFAVGER